MRLDGVVSCRSCIGKDLVDHRLLCLLVFAIEFSESVLHSGHLGLTRPNVLQEALVDSLFRSRVESLESSDQTVVLATSSTFAV